MNVYQQELIDHYRNPRNKGVVAHAQFEGKMHNPSCGDSVSMAGSFDNSGVLTTIGFDGSGCVISQAAASLLTEYCKGKTGEHIKNLDVDFMQKLVGIDLGPGRVKCALLALQALQAAIAIRN
ncbi:MAG TPA: iron-sulfur cluster assembly scaffold protein [Candidatus Limnocylindria bacterium]|nr:iron-sulfur cluster assembly scaffold protein [Candidatus Limnocylindria bacterium]